MTDKKKKAADLPEHLRHYAMHKRTFTITQSMHARMERFLVVNWSAVVREKLDEFLEELEN